MRIKSLLLSAVTLTALCVPALSQTSQPATLVGHAVLPAASFVEAPADAPNDLKTSGKYTTGKRVDALASVMGKSFERETGISLPFKGQPRQGHSGMSTAERFPASVAE